MKRRREEAGVEQDSQLGSRGWGEGRTLSGVTVSGLPVSVPQEAESVHGPWILSCIPTPEGTDC